MNVKNKQLLYKAMAELNMEGGAVALEITNDRVDIDDMPVIINNQFSEKKNKKGKYKRDWE